jgi:cell division protein FtsQ
VNGSVLSLPRGRGSFALRLLPSGRALITGIASLSIAAGLYGLARETGMFAIERVQVRGGTPAIAEQVRLALRSFVGTNLLALNGAAVVQKLESLPTIRSATYDRAFPHTLRVLVVPEQPVAVLRRGQSSWLVSARGRVIGPTDRLRFSTLPRIWLPASAEIDVGSILADDAGAAAARALTSFASSGFPRRVAWARVDAGSLRLGLRSGLELRFGPTTELPLKIAVAQSILPTLVLPANGGPTYLDLSVPDRPVAGTNPKPAG